MSLYLEQYMFGPLMFISPIYGGQLWDGVVAYAAYQGIRMVLALGIKPGGQLTNICLNRSIPKFVWRSRMGILRGEFEMTRKHLFCTVLEDLVVGGTGGAPDWSCVCEG